MLILSYHIYTYIHNHIDFYYITVYCIIYMYMI